MRSRSKSKANFCARREITIGINAQVGLGPRASGAIRGTEASSQTLRSSVWLVYLRLQSSPQTVIISSEKASKAVITVLPEFFSA